jgi:hypothetical protein
MPFARSWQAAFFILYVSPGAADTTVALANAVIASAVTREVKLRMVFSLRE